MFRAIFQRIYANAYILMPMCALFWAGNFITGRAMDGQIPPMTLAWMRWTLAATILVILTGPKLVRAWPTIRANLPLLALLALTGSALFNTLQYIALTHTTALSTAVINSSGPVLIPLAGLLIFRDRITLPQALGIAISMAGVLTIVTKGDLSVLSDLVGNSFGELLMLTSMTMIAIYSNVLRKRPPFDLLPFVAILAIGASVFNLPMFLYEYTHGQIPTFTPVTIAAVLYVAVFPSILSYLFFSRSIELIGPAKTSIFMHLVPLYVAILGIVLLGEPPRLYHAIGFLLIVIGVAIVVRPNAKKVA